MIGVCMRWYVRTLYAFLEVLNQLLSDSSVLLEDKFFFSELSSPNYPNVPPPETECVWTVLSPAGTRIFADVRNLDVKTSHR